MQLDNRDSLFLYVVNFSNSFSYPRFLSREKRVRSSIDDHPWLFTPHIHLNARKHWLLPRRHTQAWVLPLLLCVLMAVPRLPTLSLPATVYTFTDLRVTGKSLLLLVHRWSTLFFLLLYVFNYFPLIIFPQSRRCIYPRGPRLIASFSLDTSGHYIFYNNSVVLQSGGFCMAVGVGQGSHAQCTLTLLSWPSSPSSWRS